MATLSCPFLFVRIQNKVESAFDNWGENLHSRVASSPSLTSIVNGLSLCASTWDTTPEKEKKKKDVKIY